VDPEKHAAERLQHVVEFLEAHFGDVEFVDPGQQGDVSMAEQTDTKTQMDVESKPEAEEEKREEDEENKDLEMDDGEGDQDYSKPNNVPFPLGPHLLVKVDKYEARVTIPSMVCISGLLLPACCFSSHRF
jgi:hypothetical protein